MTAYFMPVIKECIILTSKLNLKKNIMRKLIVILLIFSFQLSQGQPVVVHAEINPAWKKNYRASATKINDLIHTKLDVNFDFTKSRMYGKAWLTLSPHFYPTDSLTLDAKGMHINEILLINGSSKKKLNYQYDSMQLFIKLDKTYLKGQKYTVYIDYISRPDEYEGKASTAITGAKGLYFINPRGEKKNEPTQIWTQGETESNSVWMPTIDKPDQKSTEEITMTVPSKFVTLSNGLLVNQKKNADGTRSDTWKLDLPHAPYLFFMGVGEYSIVKDSYEGKEVSYYVEKEYAPVARGIFGGTPEMMKFFSKILRVDYQWPKYAQIVGREYVSGAMENTTATLHQESAYQNARQLLDGNTWEHVIAHELFHHWFGDLVTAESWSNLTVNESFADYSETMWTEYKYGKDAADEYNYNAMKTYLMSGDSNKDLVRFYYKDKEDMFDAVSYQKGGRILKMLREYTGDDAFFAALNQYLVTNKFKTGEAHQLRLAFEDVTGQDMNWFWNQWYFGSGNPEVTIKYLYNDTAGKAQVIVEQTQKGNLFKLPLKIDVYTGNNKTRYERWLNNKIDTFEFSYTSRPDLINVDAQKTMLWEKTDNKTADNFRKQFKSAPLYLDRREALEYFGKNKMPDLAWGLNDSFSGIRKLSLDLIMKNEQVAENDFLPLVEKIAMSDPDRKTKAKAIEALAGLGDKKYLTLFQKNLHDSSYSIAGAALEGIAKLVPDSSYILAKSVAADSRGKLGEVANQIIMKNGIEADFEYLYDRIRLMPLTQEKFAAIAAFGQYLAGIDDPGKIKLGVDEIVTFKNSIPEDYRQYTDPVFNGILQNIASKKGGEVKDYIENALQ